MNRERALKVVMVLVGLLFSALIYPLTKSSSLWHANQSEDIEPMMLSVYVTLGIFLLIAARNPSANRSLIAFTAWSSFAHATVMAVQAFQNASARGGLLGAAAAFVVIGVTLIALAPAKHSVERTSAPSHRLTLRMEPRCTSAKRTGRRVRYEQKTEAGRPMHDLWRTVAQRNPD